MHPRNSQDRAAVKFVLEEFEAGLADGNFALHLFPECDWTLTTLGTILCTSLCQKKSRGRFSLYGQSQQAAAP